MTKSINNAPGADNDDDLYSYYNFGENPGLIPFIPAATEPKAVEPETVPTEIETAELETVPTEIETAELETVEPETVPTKTAEPETAPDPQEFRGQVAAQVQNLFIPEAEDVKAGGVLANVEQKVGGLTREEVRKHIAAIKTTPFPADLTNIDALPSAIHQVLQLAHNATFEHRNSGGKTEMEYAPGLLGAVRSKIDELLKAEANPQARLCGALTVIKTISMSPSGIHFLRRTNANDWSSFMSLDDFPVLLALIVNQSKKGVNGSARAHNMGLVRDNLDEDGIYNLLVTCDDLAELEFTDEEINSFRQALALELVNSCLHPTGNNEDEEEQCDFEVVDDELDLYTGNNDEGEYDYLNSDYIGNSHDITRNTAFLNQTDPLDLDNRVVREQFHSSELGQVLGAIRRLDGEFYEFIMEKLLNQSQNKYFSESWGHHLTVTRLDFNPLTKKIIKAINPNGGIAALNKNIGATVNNFFKTTVNQGKPETNRVALPLPAVSSSESNQPPASEAIVEVDRRRR